jgi:hypothetical protein
VNSPANTTSTRTREYCEKNFTRSGWAEPLSRVHTHAKESASNQSPASAASSTLGGRRLLRIVPPTPPARTRDYCVKTSPGPGGRAELTLLPEPDMDMSPTCGTLKRDGPAAPRDVYVRRSRTPGTTSILSYHTVGHDPFIKSEFASSD